MSRSNRQRSRGVPWLPLGGVVVALAVVVVVILVVQSGEGDVPSTSPVAATEESISIGRRLYENNCQLCHGVGGEGSALAPDLTFHVPLFNDGALFVRISDGFPTNSDEKTMPAFRSQLTETERWHIVNFLRDALGDSAEPLIPEDLS